MSFVLRAFFVVTLFMPLFAWAEDGGDPGPQGLIVVQSTGDFDVTYQRLIAAISARDGLRVFAEIDHAENARRNGLELEPTRLVLLGNPAIGTGLMQQTRSLAIDLPQKILVYKVGDTTRVAFNDPHQLMDRHGATQAMDRASRIRGLLMALAKEAALPKGES